MTKRLSPPQITTSTDARDHLPIWGGLVGGEMRDGVVARRRRDGKSRVREFRLDFPSIGTVLTVSLVCGDSLIADFDKLDP